jgi:competence protein ComEC
LVPVSIFCDEIVVTGQRNDPLGNLIAIFRRDCISLIHRYLPQPQASLLLGMLFGSDEPLSPQFRDVFNATNTAHIIAVSGFNISLIAGLLQTSSRYLGRKGSMILSSCGLFVFMFFVGWDNIPALRAVIMHCYSSIAVWDGYRIDDLNGLGIAAVVIAIINPAACIGLSFQLTMAASLGMIILKPLLSKIITIPVLNNREVLTAIACQLATIPFLLSLNKTVSLWGIIANVGIAPLILPVMVCGAAGLLVQQFFPVLGAYVFLPATALLDLLCWIVHFFGTLAVTNASLIKELLLLGLGVFLWSYIYRTFINK